MLEKNFNELESRGSVVNDIAQVVDVKQTKLRKEDGVSQSRGRQILSRSARFTMSTEKLVMGLARLDKHGIAPMVLGGVYTVIKVIQNDSDECNAAMSLTLDIAELIALWNSIGKYQISKNLNPNLYDLYKKLSNSIVHLYKNVIVFLGTRMAYFDKSRWGEHS